MQDFVHLHVHTQYSILDGQASVKKLVDKAIADGMRGMAVTDHGNMFGIKEFYNYVKKVNGKREKEGLDAFIPIIGCEMYCARRSRLLKDKNTKDDKSGWHLIVLAKNEQGYHNLVKLVSHSWVEGHYYRPRTDHEELEKYHEGLIVSSACLAGEIPSYIREGDVERAEKSVEWFKNLFGDDFYLELMRHEVKNPNINANRETFILQQEVNREVIRLAKKFDVKLICTNDSHFVNEEDAEAHDRLICLSTGKDLDDPSRMLYSKQEWFKTREEMNEVFSDVPEALANTIDVLEKVEQYSIDHKAILPDFPLPDGFADADEYLRHLTYEGAKRCYGEDLNDEVRQRIDFELDTIKNMGFPGYFLIVQDYIRAAREQLDVWVGPGRGSAAGSVVSYCLDITRLDPLKYDLLFERFLNPDRISLPDIDVDFDVEGRGRVLQYITDKYGEEKVAHIISYQQMKTKMVIKDVARVEKVPLKISDSLCKAIPNKLPNDLDMNMSNAISVIPELKAAATDPNNEALRETMKYAQMLENNVRGTGVHACGVIICRDDITDWVPVSTAEDKDTKEEFCCTQYEGSVIEETGLIKMDFLGLKNLNIMKETVQNIRETTGEEVDIDHIDIDDELTYKLYSEGNTVGTFQFESIGMQKHLRNLKPTKFEDLIAMNALYRPGPMKYIPDFIDRKHGLKPIVYDIPCMEQYLKDTYGITVYQEQVMLLSRQLAGFTRGESDTLRKAMGKKQKDKLDHLKPKFIDGGKKNGHDEKVLEKIWGDWEDFASYAFNKSHAACYSWVAFQTAYLKAHYPSQYMAACMSRSLGNITEVSKLMDECRTMGIKTLGPDVNESNLKFTSNKDGNIRFGLAAIKGVGNSAAQALIDERKKNGLYKDIFDVVERVNLSSFNRKGLESMILSGGFDSFGLDRELYFAEDAGEVFLDTLIRYGNKYQQDKLNSQNSLFGGMDDFQAVHPKLPKTDSYDHWSDVERLNKERELIGIYLSAHPLDEFAFHLEYVCNTKVDELKDLVLLNEKNKGDILFGGIITDIQNRISKDGRTFGVVRIEDFSGSHDLFFSGQTWTDMRPKLLDGMPTLMRGKISSSKWDKEKLFFSVNSADIFADVKDKILPNITLRIPLEELTETMVDDLSGLIDESPGETSLSFNITQGVKNVSLRSRTRKISMNKKLFDYINQNKEVISVSV